VKSERRFKTAKTVNLVKTVNLAHTFFHGAVLLAILPANLHVVCSAHSGSAGGLLVATDHGVAGDGHLLVTDYT
jgi:hypothetical protein